MKQREINEAYPCLGKLLGINLPLKKARALYEMYTALEASYNFAVREQQKYLKEYNAEFIGGYLKFNGEDKEADRCAFHEKINALQESEVDLYVEPVTITEEELGGHRVSVIDIHRLKGFVFFD